jgi:hypothetical protein
MADVQMAHVAALPRVGLLWRGDRDTPEGPSRGEDRLGPLLAAFRELPVVIDYVLYAEGAADRVREQLLACDVVMVWVNPIQDGQNRAALDSLLRDVAAHGVMVSAHPDEILKLGTKEVLYAARDLIWGSDVERYQTPEEFVQRFPARLATHARLVVKQGRGNGGDGVWKVELLQRPAEGGPVRADARIDVQDARVTDGSSEQMLLRQFLAIAAECFQWSACLIDQPFQERLADGMLRCYFTRDEVVGFCRQWPKRGLLGPEEARSAASAPESIWEPADTPALQALRRDAEAQWLPELMGVLGLGPQSLPLIWDADFLFGPRTASGEDTYILCEINASAVWPFPPSAARTVARAALMAAEKSRAR